MLALKVVWTLLLIQQVTFCLGEKKFDATILKMVRDMLENQQETIIKESKEVNNDKLSIVQNNIIGIQKSIKNLQHDLNDSEDVQILQNLDNELDKELLKSLKVLHSYNEALKNLTGCYSTITVIMKKLLTDLEDTERMNKDEILIKQCIYRIRNNEYEKAIEKLDLISEENKIYDIVESVYKFEVVDSFDKVLKFAEKIRSINKSLITYKALIRQMDLYKDNNIHHLLKIIKSLDSEIIQQSTKEHIITESKKLMELLKDKLKIAGKEDLKNRILYDCNKSHYNYSHDEIPEKLFTCDKELFNRVYWEFLNDMYTSRQASLSELIEFTYKRNYPMQKLFGFSSILDIMKKNNEMNNKEILQLANYLKLTLNKGSLKTDEHHTEDELIVIVTKIQDKLPTSVKNLVFAKKVCLKNVGYDEYFYAAGVKNEDFNYKLKESRYIFTWIPNDDRNTQNAWYMEKSLNNFYDIKNVHHNEYLYADELTYKNDDHNRQVFTWISREERYINKRIQDTSSDGNWEIIPEGDNCYIKSVAYNEYLYASKIKYDNDRRYVFTWVPKTQSTNLPYNGDALWSIEDCSWIR